MKALRCREFEIGLRPYRVFSDEGGEPVLVQALANYMMRDDLVCWRELEGRMRLMVIEHWRGVACRQLDLFLEERA